MAFTTCWFLQQGSRQSESVRVGPGQSESVRAVRAWVCGRAPATTDRRELDTYMKKNVLPQGSKRADKVRVGPGQSGPARASPSQHRTVRVSLRQPGSATGDDLSQQGTVRSVGLGQSESVRKDRGQSSKSLSARVTAHAKSARASGRQTAEATSQAPQSNSRVYGLWFMTYGL